MTDKTLVQPSSKDALKAVSDFGQMWDSLEQKDALLRQARDALELALSGPLKFSSHGVVPFARNTIAAIDAELSTAPASPAQPNMDSGEVKEQK